MKKNRLGFLVKLSVAGAALLASIPTTSHASTQNLVNPIVVNEINIQTPSDFVISPAQATASDSKILAHSSHSSHASHASHASHRSHYSGY